MIRLRDVGDKIISYKSVFTFFLLISRSLRALRFITSQSQQVHHRHQTVHMQQWNDTIAAQREEQTI